MAFAKINKSGCCERHGNVQVRVDFYLEPTDPRYNDTYIDIPVLDKKGEPTGKTKKQLNPFHSHFMYFPPDVTEAEILKEAEYHLPNFYTAFQNEWDKSPGGMRHGWAVEKRIRPTRKSLTSKDYDDVRQSCEAKIAELTEAAITIDNLEGREYPATEIDIGDEAIDRSSYYNVASYTVINVGNPANDTGIIDTIEIYAYSSMTGAKAGTFYSAGGLSYTNRDYELIGSVSSGGKRRFTGLDIDVSLGDLIGAKSSTGSIERSPSGYSGILQYYGDGFGGTYEYAALSDRAISLYGTGESLVTPTVTTSTVSNITHSSAQANGNITDTGGENCDERGFVYGTTSKSAPGNVAPASSGYDDYENETGTYSTGAYNLTLSSLDSGTTYYVRAYAHNSAGYAYGDEVSFLTGLAASFDPAVLELYPLYFTDEVKWAQGFSPAVLVTKGQRFSSEILDTVTVLTDTAIVENNQATLRGIFSGLGAIKRGFYLWDETWDYPPEV